MWKDFLFLGIAPAAEDGHELLERRRVKDKKRTQQNGGQEISWR